MPDRAGQAWRLGQAPLTSSCSIPSEKWKSNLAPRIIIGRAMGCQALCHKIIDDQGILKRWG